MIAGSFKPVFHVQNSGYINNSASSNTEINLVLTSINIADASINGGKEIILTGKNFPFSLDSHLNVKIGQAAAIISSSTNTEITAIVPKKNSADPQDVAVDVIIEYNSKTAQLSSSFTFKTSGVPKVTSVDPISASPVLKDQINISGSNFGTDKNAVRVFLDSAVKDGIYELGTNILI